MTRASQISFIELDFKWGRNSRQMSLVRPGRDFSEAIHVEAFVASSITVPIRSPVWLTLR